MALLAKTLQLLRNKGTSLTCRCLNTYIQKTPAVPVTLFNYSPTNNHWIYKQPEVIKNPLVNNIRPTIEFPNGLLYVPKIDRDAGNSIEAPTVESPVLEKRAERLIVIRRKKMKKHKLRKLRKRMKFEWAKMRQKRELKKEKEFQAVLIKQCKKAEEFSAEKYVEERLNKMQEVVLPKFWKGKLYPEDVMRQKMGLPPK